MAKSSNMEIELSECKTSIRHKDTDIKKLEKENARLRYDKDKMATDKTQAVHEKNITKAGVNSLTREIEYLRKMTDQERANIMSLIKDRNKMDKNITKANEENISSKGEISQLKNQIQALKDKDKETKQ